MEIINDLIFNKDCLKILLNLYNIENLNDLKNINSK
jgi:hypothetical protein